ncbi:MAG: hypothetical protein JKX71_12900 [Amylibacter sp.]|nr:hypothetical protein [Amylibacter sp.]
MFKVVNNPEFTHDVTVNVPVDGGHEEQTFKARFRVLAEKELIKIDHDNEHGTADLLKTLIVGMEDLIGEDEKPLPYNDALRDQMLAVGYVRVALIKTYREAVTKARVGN